MQTLPAWAETLRSRYLAGESGVFLLHGNVRDLQPWTDADGTTRWVPLREFLGRFLGRTKELVVAWSLSEGLSVRTRDGQTGREAEARLRRVLDARRIAGGREPGGPLPGDVSGVLDAAEELLVDPAGRHAVVLDYVETIAPAAPFASMLERDRAHVVTLARLAGDPALLSADNVLVLIAETLPDVAPRLASCAQLAVLDVPYPDEAARAAFLEAQDRSAVALAMDLGALARVTAGLSLVQVRGLLRIAAAGGRPLDFAAVNARKKSILEQSCAGLVEFVAPDHGFDAVGGMEGVKEELRRIAEAIRAGAKGRVPMGLLFVGPMGTGKTFVAEAFARESGLTCLKLKGIRDRWVGATEANLERVLGLVDALGYVLLIVDEADRSLGGGPEGDGGTGSRVIARLKEFMSDTRHRGRVLVLMMTNRPDKLDADLKRPGRFDVKVPFFFPETPEERVAIARAVARRAGCALQDGVDLAPLGAATAGYSAAEIESVVLAAANFAAWRNGTALENADVERALADVIPGRDTRMLAYMELLAVFEASARRMLPARYAQVSTDEVQARLDMLRAQLGARVS
ncbi:MAG: hypothetical protein RLZZ299_2513 [Pseudomonadota bacterium]|jgi:ATP-dependent 26S proteasome regulatory subunit